MSEPVPQATAPSSAAAPARTGARFGVWALVLALVMVIWPTLNGVALILSLSDTMPDAVRILAIVMFFIGWAVVPLSFISSLIFGILAIRRNRRLGRILGVIALVVVTLALVALIALGAFGFLGSGFLGTGIGV